jgi:sugar phosphate isomerase/epimerase
MRFGGPVLKPYRDPDEWLAHVREMDYSAVYFPLNHTAPRGQIDAYVTAIHDNGLHIAEVGAWSNPLSPDGKIARQAFDLCCGQLELADRIGAGCCVNIAGSCSDQWDGPHEDNFRTETFVRIVDTVRRIIDTVQPRRTFYTLELMPWMFPDSVDTYLDLIKAIDRPAFAVHLDPVNIICSPRVYYDNSLLIRDCFARLGPYIKSCHAKDIKLETSLTTHLNETRPGAGNLDYRTYLACLSKLPDSVSLMMEHMNKHDEVVQAAAHIRLVAAGLGIKI